MKKGKKLDFILPSTINFQCRKRYFGEEIIYEIFDFHFAKHNNEESFTLCIHI